MQTCQRAVNLPLSVFGFDVEGDVHLLLFVIGELRTHTNTHTQSVSVGHEGAPQSRQLTLTDRLTL